MQEAFQLLDIFNSLVSVEEDLSKNFTALL